MPQSDETDERSAQHLAVMRASRKAYKFPKGKTGRSGLTRAYYQARELARLASPRMMQGLIEDADKAEDERVRSVCRLAVLDRAGVRPMDFDPAAEAKAHKPAFNPADYSDEELAQIEQSLRLIVTRSREKERARAQAAGEPTATDEDGSEIHAEIVDE